MTDTAYDRTVANCARLALVAAALKTENEQLREAVDDAHRTIRILTGAAAWFAVWECGCTITERKPDRIVEFCPVHGEPLVSDNKGRTKVELNHSGVSGYGFREVPA